MMTEVELKDVIVKVLDDKKAQDLKCIEVGDKTIIADYFIICSGTSTTHVKALCGEVEDKLKELLVAPTRVEGYNEGRWIVMDFSSVLVHIFHPDERSFYNMERLWSDGQ